MDELELQKECLNQASCRACPYFKECDRDERDSED